MNKDFLTGVFVGAVLFFILAFLFLPAYSVSIVHSPGAEKEIVSLISSAESSIYVEMYVLTSYDVLDALVSAKERGVEIRVLLEERVSNGTNDYAYSKLSGCGAQVRWASRSYKLTHSKLIIVDKKKALVGSHNLSNSALNFNREVSLIVEGNVVQELLDLFTHDWNTAHFV